MKLISDLGGIENTNYLAKQYFNKSVRSAEKIRNLKIKQEMVELAELAFNREK